MSNKIILVTGAFGLIGLPLSVDLIKRGHKVVLGDIDNVKRPQVDSYLNNLDLPSDAYLTVILDITSETSIQSALRQTIEKYGDLHVLINNAAIDAKFDPTGKAHLESASFENYPIDVIKKSLEVNTLGTVLVTQLFCRYALERGFGNIVNVASTYSLLAPNQELYDWGQATESVIKKPVDYIVSKSFIPNFTRYIATYYGKKNIRCNAIAPHGVYNNHESGFLDNFSKLSPMGRMCDVEELFGTFQFLISDESKYMTGSTLVIDGGWSAW